MLLVGLETEYITQDDLTRLEALLDQYKGRVDYIVGSLHHANGVPIDFDLPTFRKALQSFSGPGEMEERQLLDALFCSYFDAQYELLCRFHPEIIGHIDLCRLYYPDLRFSDFPATWEKIERNVLYAVQYGALFEANAAALRKGWKSGYPGKDVMEVKTNSRPTEQY